MTNITLDKCIPSALRRQIFDIRCRSKRAQTITDDELKLCERARNQYPTDYASLSGEVFEATKPFGSM